MILSRFHSLFYPVSLAGHDNFCGWKLFTSKFFNIMGVKLLCSSKWFNPCFHLYGEP